MTPAHPAFENTFARDLPDMFEPWEAVVVENPELLVLDDELALELGFDPQWLRSPDGVRFLIGNHRLEGMQPIAQGYAGHQFGGFSPRLGDGRALLLGEVIDTNGQRRDIHLKGSGRTRYSRGGDGKAAVGPMLREYVIGGAMRALGIPTTRALAVVATGERIPRDEMLPGAVLCRVASSHLRVGSFQYAATMSHDHIARLADHAIARHYPELIGEPDRHLALFHAVMNRQAKLVAQWMGVGFIHGVMNTDNMTISGETIDYGPCAFLDTHDPTTVFSSIDHQGRYAYQMQPRIVEWNCYALGQAMVPLIGDVDTVKDALAVFQPTFEKKIAALWRAKLGMVSARDDDDALVRELLTLMAKGRVDFPVFFRRLSSLRREDPSADEPLRNLFIDRAGFDAWLVKYRARLEVEQSIDAARKIAMDQVNPKFVLRNHLAQIAIQKAQQKDFSEVQRLLHILQRPFDEQPEYESYAALPPDWAAGISVSCSS